MLLQTWDGYPYYDGPREICEWKKCIVSGPVDPTSGRIQQEDKVVELFDYEEDTQEFEEVDAAVLVIASQIEAKTLNRPT